MPLRTRRLKLVYVDENLLLDSINAWGKYEFLQLPVSPQLPDGVQVERISYDFARRAFAMLVSHDSFREVPPGCFVEIIGESQEVIVLRRKKLSDDYTFPPEFAPATEEITHE